MKTYQNKRFIVKAETGEDGTTIVTASTPDVDRFGDVVAPSWDLDHYKSNPIIVFSHDYGKPPIGKALTVAMDGTALIARIQWDTADDNELGKTISRQFKEGYLSSVSVGFAPGDSVQRSTLDDDHPWHGKSGMVYGMNAPNQLLEISACCIPANPNATAIRSAPTPETIRDTLIKLLTTDDGIRAEIGSTLADWAPPKPSTFFDLLTD